MTRDEQVRHGTDFQRAGYCRDSVRLCCPQFPTSLYARRPRLRLRAAGAPRCRLRRHGGAQAPDIVNTHVLTVALDRLMLEIVVEAKTAQLQIRVSERQKRKLRQRARAAAISVSELVLRLAFPPERDEFERLVGALHADGQTSFALAALNDFLAQRQAADFESILSAPPGVTLGALDSALLASMIEHAASRVGARVPHWVASTPAVDEPFFASELKGLRLYLLTSSPPAFRRRNLFVDTSVGGRV